MVRFRPEAPIFADVAHLVERHLAKVEVAGSSPVIRSIFLLNLFSAEKSDFVGLFLFAFSDKSKRNDAQFL